MPSSRRQLQNWLSGWVEYTKESPSPEHFRLWSGISMLCGAMQRRCWITPDKEPIYTNEYIFLVGPPASGKTQALEPARKLFRKISTFHVSPVDFTPAAFYNVLAKYPEGCALPHDPMYKYHALSGFVDELGTLMDQPDRAQMSHFAKAYDCDEIFEKTTVHAGDKKIENVCFNLVAGSTDEHLGQVFTDSILKLGMPSRCLFIYAGEKYRDTGGKRRKTFRKIDRESDAVLYQKLLHDLECMSLMRGEFAMDSGGLAAYEEWENEEFKPVPTDPKLLYYVHRRHIHILKLCMAASCAREDDLIINQHDVLLVKALLLEAEKSMPLALHEVGKGMSYQQTSAAIAVIKSLGEKFPNGVPESIVRRELGKTMQITQVQYTLDELLRSQRLIRMDPDPKVPGLYKAGKE